MMQSDAKEILDYAVQSSLPYDSTVKLLRGLSLPQNLTVFSIGKAAVPMARAAADVLQNRIKTGMVVTKYGHVGTFCSPYFEVMEASHPVSDENSVLAAQKALEIADLLTEKDTVVVLLSGGASALFEKSNISLAQWRMINERLLSRGADITQMNTLRACFSAVKGGKFAARCYPAKVITVALSDVLTNDRAIIGGGITVAPVQDRERLRDWAQKYLYDIPKSLSAYFDTVFEPQINDGGYYFAGDIHSLCNAAVQKAKDLGYVPHLITECLTGEARDKSIEISDNIDFCPGKHAYILGGETTVTVKGNGKGGRNQEMALSAAIVLRQSKNIVFASLGSDGTDGPTDAAGGMVDGETYDKMCAAGISPEDELDNNNAYYALKASDSLLITGPTGTNVNDIIVILTDI